MGITRKTNWLVDTNVLLRFVACTHSISPIIRRAIRILRERGDILRVAPQNLIEFWNVATRPAAANGLGYPVERTERLLHRLERLFPPLSEDKPVYSVWCQLVSQFGVSGVQVHDAHLVAVMNCHEITHILTLNPRDFARYAPIGIVIVNPTTLVAAP